MNNRLFYLVCVVLVLGGCTGPIIMGTDAAVTVATKPWSPPAADTQDQIAPHESWCYSTMGEPECFAHPQDVPPERLINVDPQNRYPVDLPAYHEALEGRPAMTAVPSSDSGAPMSSNQPANVTDQEDMSGNSKVNSEEP